MKGWALSIGFLLCYWALQAQFCGASGGFICPETDTLGEPAYYPVPDSLPAFTNNLSANVILQFENYDSILFGSEVLHVYAMTFDSVENLPPGLCWSTDEADNTYTSGQRGCMKITGRPCGPTGQYLITTIVTVDIGTSVVTNANYGGFKYFMRLKNYGEPEIAVDTTQTADSAFIPYGDTCHAEAPLAVNLGPDSVFCEGSYINFAPSVNGGFAPYTYAWQSVGTSLTCDNCSNPTAILNQNSTFILTITDINGDQASDTVNYSTAGGFQDFSIDAGGPVFYCDTGTVVLLSASGITAGYQWLRNDSIIRGATLLSDTVKDSTGAYQLIYTLPGECVASSNIITLSFFNKPYASITSDGSTTICSGGEVILSAAIVTGASYQWQLNGITQTDSEPATFTAVSPGTYQLIASVGDCADTSNTVTLFSSTNPPPDVTFYQYMGDTICNNSGSFTLTGGAPAGGNYSGAGVSENIFNPDSAGTGTDLLTYFYIDSNGCGVYAYDSVVVEICTGINADELTESLLVFPNPAENDLFISTGAINISSVNIYDIAGKRISFPANPTAPGQLRLDLHLLASGMYWIELRSGGKTTFRKFIKLSE